jgi:hypothetical protein
VNFPQILVSSVLTLTKQPTRMSKRLLNDISSTADEEVVFMKNVKRRLETLEANSVDSNSVDSNSVDSNSVDSNSVDSNSVEALGLRSYNVWRRKNDSDAECRCQSCLPVALAKEPVVPPAMLFPYGSDSEHDTEFYDASSGEDYYADVTSTAAKAPVPVSLPTFTPVVPIVVSAPVVSAPVVSAPVVPVEVQMCIICQDVLESSGANYSLMCAHVFHTECIELWLRCNPVCPICRAEVTVVTVPEEVRRFPAGVSNLLFILTISSIVTFAY